MWTPTQHTHLQFPQAATLEEPSDLSMHTRASNPLQGWILGRSCVGPGSELGAVWVGSTSLLGLQRLLSETTLGPTDSYPVGRVVPGDESEWGPLKPGFKAVVSVAGPRMMLKWAYFLALLWIKINLFADTNPFLSNHFLSKE